MIVTVGRSTIIGRSIVVLEDRLFYRKIDCIIGRSTIIGRSIVVLEDRLFYWKINSRGGLLEFITGG